VYHPGCRDERTAWFELTCVDCGRVRTHRFSKGRRLPLRCRECGYARRVGDGNANWRGGITPEHQRIRASEEYKQWRKAVFERDNFTCVWCGQHGGTLNADHIKPFALHPTLRFGVSHGRTLCKRCHEQTDTYLSKGKKLKDKYKKKAVV